MSATEETRWSSYRDFFAATREAMIVGAVVMVFVAPSMVRQCLQRAGISSFAGLEFGIEEIVDANEKVQEAEGEVAHLAAQLANVEQRLEVLSMGGRSAKPEEIQKIVTTVHSMKSKADSVDQSLRESTQQFDHAIKLMPPEKLRELAERNRQQAQATAPPIGIPQQSTITLPPQVAKFEDLQIPPTVNETLSLQR